MLKLNLLPPAEKKKLKLAELQKRIYLLFLWLGAILIVFIALLIAAYFNLEIILNEQEDLIIEREADQKNQEIALIKQRVDQVSQRLSVVDNKQQGFISWTSALLGLSRIVPDGVYLTGFNYQKTGGKLDISGHARTRDDLLLFESRLEQSDYFAEVESPLSNIIKQTDINFSFSLRPLQYFELSQ